MIVKNNDCNGKSLNDSKTDSINIIIGKKVFRIMKESNNSICIIKLNDSSDMKITPLVSNKIIVS